MAKEFHEGDCGGNHSRKFTANNILRVGFYWPSLFLDVYKEMTRCYQCQIFEGRRKVVSLPLNPISMVAPFQQWGLDIIGEIKPNFFGQHKCILTTTDYSTKWIEAIPSQRAIEEVIMDFIENNSP